MVDTISSTKGIRQTGSATARYGAPSAPSSLAATGRTIAPVAAASNAGRQEQQDGKPQQDGRQQAQDGAQDLRLEIAEDEGGKELVYRFVDAVSGDVVREWDAGEFGKLRDYMRDKKIHLLDKTI